MTAVYYTYASLFMFNVTAFYSLCIQSKIVYIARTKLLVTVIIRLPSSCIFSYELYTVQRLPHMKITGMSSLKKVE